MAIKRLNPKAVFKIVSQYDDALDLDLANGPEGENLMWAKYLERFDIGVLKFKEGEKPTLFHVRPLLNEEVAEINEKYLEVDTVSKKSRFKNRPMMLLEMFDKAVIGREDEPGKIEACKANEVPYGVALSIGSLVSILATLDQSSKNG